MTLVKICGVTRVEDVTADVDFIGFNFWPGSKRYLPPARWPALAAATTAVKVGVFVDQPLAEIAALHRVGPFDVVQLHGHESIAFAREVAALGVRVWKAHSIASVADVAALAAWDVDAVLLDGPKPGSGQRFDHALVVGAPHPRVVLAGGLTPETVAAAIARVQPWAVDVASGVESAPGIKDAAKVAAFVAACRAR